jgi:hypothetical protein
MQAVTRNKKNSHFSSQWKETESSLANVSESNQEALKIDICIRFCAFENSQT